MVHIKKLLEENTPFAVMQYFESYKRNKDETCRKYELVYVNGSKKVCYKLLNKNELDFFKINLKKFELVLKNNDGSVYEFNKFKEYKEAVVVFN